MSQEIPKEQLEKFIERIEEFTEEKSAAQESIKSVYDEAKFSGIDVKVLRQVIKLRKMSIEDREEHEMILEQYKSTLGLSLRSNIHSDIPHIELITNEA